METVTDNVEVTVGGQKFSRSFTKTLFQTREDFLQALNSDDRVFNELKANQNYAIDYNERQKARQIILNGEAAAASAAEKAVKELMKVRAAAGRPITEDQAREIIIG
jgi:hypothetical protein